MIAILLRSTHRVRELPAEHQTGFGTQSFDSVIPALFLYDTNINDMTRFSNVVLTLQRLRASDTIRRKTMMNDIICSLQLHC